MNKIEFLYNRDKYQGIDSSKTLSHYGILGQKWGQRRWQNADGTFNEAGKERYFGPSGTTKKNKEEKNSGKKNLQDQKIGKYEGTPYLMNNGKKFHIDYQNSDGSLTKKGLKLLNRAAKHPKLFSTKNLIDEDYYDKWKKDLLKDYYKTDEEKENSEKEKQAEVQNKINEIKSSYKIDKNLSGDKITVKEFKDIIDELNNFDKRDFERNHREEYNKVADMGIDALNKAEGYDEHEVGDDGTRMWFMWEDQTDGLGEIAYLRSKGYSKDYVKQYLESPLPEEIEEIREKNHYATPFFVRDEFYRGGDDYIDALYDNNDGSDQKIGGFREIRETRDREYNLYSQNNQNSSFDPDKRIVPGFNDSSNTIFDPDKRLGLDFLEDTKIGSTTLGFDKRGKAYYINDKYQNSDGTLTKKGLKMLKKGKNIEDFADAELYEKSKMTPEEIDAYDEKKYWSPVREIDNKIQTTKELKGKDITDEEFKTILNDTTSMYELRQDRNKRQEYNDVGDITLLALKKAGWLDNDCTPGDDDSRFWALNEDQTIGFGALADLYYKGYSKDYIKQFIDKTEKMTNDDFDKHPGAWEINYATDYDEGKKFVDALFSKDDINIDRFGSQPNQKIGSAPNSKKLEKEAKKLDKQFKTKYGDREYYDSDKIDEWLDRDENKKMEEAYASIMDKAFGEKSKEIKEIFKDYEDHNEEYVSKAAICDALSYGDDLDEIASEVHWFLSDDGDQGDRNSHAYYMHEKGYTPEQVAQKDKEAQEAWNEGSTVAKQLSRYYNPTTLYMKNELQNEIFDQVNNRYNKKDDYSIYRISEAADSSGQFVKDHVKVANDFSKKLAPSCSDGNGWYYFNQAIQNLNMGAVDYRNITPADWDKINAEINKLKQ